MLPVIVILLGMSLEIVNANKWFIVPDMAIYIVFGIGVVLTVVSVVSWIIAKENLTECQKG